MKESQKIGMFLFLYSRGELTPAEKEELLFWRNQDPENERLFFQMTDPDSLRKEMQDYYNERDRDFEKLKEQLPFLSETRLSESMNDDVYNYFENLLPDNEDEGDIIMDEDASSGLSPMEYWGSMIADTDKKGKTEDSPGGKMVEIGSESSPRGMKTKRWVQTLLAVAVCVTIILVRIDQQFPKSNTDRFQASLFSSDAVDKAGADMLRGYGVGRAGIKISHNAAGDPVYTVPNEKTAAYEKTYLLKTPAGGEFILQLPDGTLIWLNDSSTVKYPANFDQQNIAIEITGEVFIERSKNAFYHFNISISRQDESLRAAGLTLKTEPLSQCNINAYPDKKEISVTLISGRAKLIHGNTDNGFQLPIGKQAVIVDGSVRSVLDVGVQDVSSWKNGTFYYRETSIQHIMQAIARWYGVDLYYPMGIPDKKFNLRMERSAELCDILKNLQSQGLHVTYLGNNITIWK